MARSRLLAALAALAVVAGACGPGTAEPPPTGSSAPPAQTGASSTPSARPTARPTASPSAAPPTAAIGDRVLVAGRQYLKVLRAEEWLGRQPNLGSRFVSVLVEIEAVVDSSYRPSLFSVDTGTDVKAVASNGRRPRFASSRSLRPGQTYEAWLTFSLPLGCRCELLYALPVGGGQRSEPVRVSLDPIGPPSDDPIPTSAPPPELTKLGRDFFGPDVDVRTYEVNGRTRAEIARSIEANGPRLEWLGGTAAAVTQVRASANFTLRGSASNCQVVTTGDEAIDFSYRITLPSWDAPSNAPAATVDWWNDEFRAIAVHERTHVEIYRDGIDELNEVVESSTCENLESRLDRAWAPINREQCEFDMREYGAELGLSIDECLSQGE
jgi:predicted secreted Zn-dependent protease